MSWALRDDVSIDTTIKRRRLPRPSAATGHVFNRIRNPQHSGEPFRQDYPVRSYHRHPANTGEPSRQSLGARDKWTCPREHPSPAKAFGFPCRPDSNGLTLRCLLGRAKREETPRQPQANAPAVWTAERLRACVDKLCCGDRIVVLANCEPFRHERMPDGSIKVRRSASGLVTALEPLVQACSGVWVAH